jgi:hypothetical protein
VRRDDLFTLQVDGSKASAIAGLHRCWTQTGTQTAKTAAFNVATDLGVDYRSGWDEVAAAAGPYRNPYRVGWEDFLRHLVAGTPLSADFAAGIRPERPDLHFFIFSMVATMFLTVAISGFSGSRAMNLLKDSSAFP